MNRRHILAVKVDTIMNRAMRLSTIVDQGIIGIDTCKGGHPTQTTGANPDTTKTRPPNNDEPCTATTHHQWPCTCASATPETTSTPERGALTPDQAALDETAIRKALDTAQRALNLTDQLLTRYLPPNQRLTNAARLAALDANLWCDNCGRWGYRNVKRPGHNYCEFCAGFSSTWKQYPPKDVLDLQSAKGRIYDTDIRRILARHKEAKQAAKKRPATKGAA